MGCSSSEGAPSDCLLLARLVAAARAFSFRRERRRSHADIYWTRRTRRRATRRTFNKRAGEAARTLASAEFRVLSAGLPRLRQSPRPRRLRPEGCAAPPELLVAVLYLRKRASKSGVDSRGSWWPSRRRCLDRFAARGYRSPVFAWRAADRPDRKAQVPHLFIVALDDASAMDHVLPRIQAQY